MTAKVRFYFALNTPDNFLERELCMKRGVSLSPEGEGRIEEGDEGRKGGGYRGREGRGRE